jgi:hypothetical protein
MANKAEECRLRAEQCEQTAKAATKAVPGLIESVGFPAGSE